MEYCRRYYKSKKKKANNIELLILGILQKNQLITLIPALQTWVNHQLTKIALQQTRI